MKPSTTVFRVIQKQNTIGKLTGYRFISSKPALTLFSGPTCSLCEDAKKILSDIEPDHPFTLNTIDIHAPGQEKWKRKYVYEIPVLHLEDRVIAKGRWDANSVRQAIIGWQNEDGPTRTDKNG